MNIKIFYTTMKGLTKDYLLQVIEENKRKKYPIILDFNFNNDDIIDKLLQLLHANIDYKATKILFRPSKNTKKKSFLF